LTKSDVQIITPNPKTSGGARWNYLAAWGYALKANNNDESKAKEFIKPRSIKTFRCWTRARAQHDHLAQRGIGDVLLSWENEAYLVQKEFGADQYEIIAPSVSILAEPPRLRSRCGGRRTRCTRSGRCVPQVPLQPRSAGVGREASLPPAQRRRVEKETPAISWRLKLFTIDEVFGGWQKGPEDALCRWRFCSINCISPPSNRPVNGTPLERPSMNMVKSREQERSRLKV